MVPTSQSEGPVRIGEWLLEAELHQLKGPQRSVHLEPRTTAVLMELAAHAGRVRTREELLDAVWGDAFVGEAALTHCIWELRRAFGDDARNPSFIQTVPRRGYRLVAPVSGPPEVAVRALLAAKLAAGTGGADERRKSPMEPPFETRLRELLADHPGELAQLGEKVAGGEGDLCFVAFERPILALRFALELQAEVGSGEEGDSGAAVALHLGEAELRGTSNGDSPRREVRGSAAAFVASLQSLALPRQTLVTRGIFDVARPGAEELSSTPAELRWLAHGEFVFPGSADPVELFEVGVEGFAPLRAPQGTAAAHPLGLDRTVLGWRPAPGLAIPQRPHWELRRKLGEGGFGEVWLTRHLKTGDRRVFKFCLDVECLRALQREVTLFRLLKESLGGRRDITRILDWSFRDAPYFLEMEYIEGGSFADWAAARGGLERVPRTTRIEIIAQAAEALAAAHSIGVLHKDVKPGNLLIGPGREDQPRVLLSDFGIGRLADPGVLEDAGITALGLTEARTRKASSSESGTRLYLAPELLEGKPATIQSDIYALGVVLYQALAGGFDRAMGPGWRRNIADPLLREDIARCVDLAPEQRPRSALEVAEGLRSLEARRRREEEERMHLALAPALAQRRRRWLAGGAAVAVAVVVSVLTGVAMEARSKAERSRDQAERLVTFMLGDLRDTLQGVGRLDAMEGTAAEVVRYYASLPVDEMTDEGLARRAAALRQIGEVRSRAGSLPDAEAAFEEAARVADSLAARDPSRNAWQADRADSHFWLGDVRRRQGDPAGARDSFAAHRRIYQRLVARDPGREGWRLELAFGHGNLGTVLAEMGETEEALGQMGQRLEIVRQLVTEGPDDPKLQLALASSHQLVGQILERRGDLEGALRSYRADHEILGPLAAADPENTRLQDRLATSAGSVGLVFWMRGAGAAARPYFEAEAEVFERLCAIDPEDTYWQHNRAVAATKVAQTLQAAGEIPKALELYRAGREALEDLVRKDPTATDLRSLLASRRRLTAGALLGEGRPAAALSEVDRAAEALRGVLAERPGDPLAILRLSAALVLRGEILDRIQRQREARWAWEAAIGLIEPLASRSDEVRYLDPWARALIALERWDEARPILDRLRERSYRAPDFTAFCRRFGVDSKDLI